MIFRFLRYVLIAALAFAPLSDVTARHGRYANVSCAEATTFLARTSGLDATHIDAYTNLICGLVTDGLWSKFDVLYIYATQDSTTALLNLVSTSFNGTAHGSPTFTADQGFTGNAGSSTVYIDTGFNPSTAGGQYSQNSAHLSTWSITNANDSNASIGAASSASGNVPSEYHLEQYIDGSYINRVNVTGGTGTQNVTVSVSNGLFLSNRSGSTTTEGYQNGGILASFTGQTSNALLNLNMFTLGINANGTASGSGKQYAAGSFGSTLNSTDALKFYNRERAYMTAVGVP